MIQVKHFPFLLTLVLLSGFYPVNAQESAQSLEKKRKQLEVEIQYTNQMIEQTRKSKQVTVNEVRLLNSRISKRNELLATLKKELSVLETEMDLNEHTLTNLERELKSLKKDYATVVYFAYKHRTSYNKLIYIFSAEDFNQAYQRLRYLDQVSDYIRREADKIRKLESIKTSEQQLLTAQMKEKNLLLEKESTQVSRLEQEQATKNELMQTLSGKEKQLKAELREKEKESRELKKKIEDIIARETAPKSTKTGTTYALTPEEKLLSDNFDSNQGKLPWPTERGIISGSFGVHQHPVLKNVKTRNNGIDIVTSPGSEARCVFDGQVVSIARITTTNIAVIVKHGEFFTVYSNLDAVFVQQGDMVTSMQPIGKIHTSLKGDTELHFEVWEGKSIQNPTRWILSR
ncbi:MAG: peptidoglycan DD-metalloendopeptidase family protein [bacterium]